MGSGPDSAYEAVGISLGPTTVHGIRRMCPGIVFLWARPLTSPQCSRSSRFGQTHLQFHPSVSVGTHTRVSLQVPLCLWLGLFPQPFQPRPFPVPFYLQSSSLIPLWALAPAPALASGVGVPVHTTACSLSPCGQEVSCPLFPPTSPHSAWLAAPQRSTVPLFPVQNSSVALYGHLGHGSHLLSSITSSPSLVSKCLSYAQYYGYPRAGPAQASLELCSSLEQREQETALANGAFPCLQGRL